MANIIRHGLYGGPRQLYGPFAGKIPENTKLTRLGLYGGSRQLYGAFGGKTSLLPGAVRLSHEGFRQIVGRLMR